MEKEVVEQFLGKVVGILFADSGEDTFIKGEVTKNTLFLANLHGNKRALALSEIKNIREVNHAKF